MTVPLRKHSRSPVASKLHEVLDDAFQCMARHVLVHSKTTRLVIMTVTDDTQVTYYAIR